MLAFCLFFLGINSKTQSSLNFLQSGPRKSTKSDFSGLAPIRWVEKRQLAGAGFWDGSGLPRPTGIKGKSLFSGAREERWMNDLVSFSSPRFIKNLATMFFQDLIRKSAIVFGVLVTIFRELVTIITK